MKKGVDNNLGTFETIEDAQDAINEFKLEPLINTSQIDRNSDGVPFIRVKEKVLLMDDSTFLVIKNFKI